MRQTTANTGRQRAKTLSAWTSQKEEAMYFEHENPIDRQSRAMTCDLYFAYGSNLDPGQMRRRCPGARASGPAVLHGYRIAFAGRSVLWNGGGVATLLPDANEWVEGVLYEVPLRELTLLDRFEGHPVAYRRRLLQIEDEHGAARAAQVYLKDSPVVAPPSPDYLKVILRAYHRLGFDDTPLRLATGGAR